MSSTESTAGKENLSAEITHPLDPLTAEEIRTAIETIRREQDLSDRARFPLIELSEPSKETVLNFSEGDPIDRAAEIVILDKGQGATYEAIVSLNDQTLTSWEQVPNVQPPILIEEWAEAEEIIVNNPEWREAARKRGVTNFDHVMVDPVSAGHFGFEQESGKRLVRGVAYYRESNDDNGYAHPIEGLIAVVDLNEKEILEIWDNDMDTMPPTHGRYDPESVGQMRTDLKPLDIVQPEGPSFEVQGNEIRWQKWRMRVSLNPREGLVLHTVGYEENGHVRPVLYRAALSEMVVPYGDTSQAHFWKGVFDAGEYGLGKMTNSLELGCDCLGEIYYFDAVLGDEMGNPQTIKNAICLHEEDDGILWKHYDERADDTQVVRSRKLVLSYICTVGNYDYAFYWNFYLNGMIRHDIKATGIMQTQGLRPGELPEYGNLVAPQLGAMHHQHIFNYRLDTMLDGSKNSVYEVEAERIPMGDDNPYGNAMRPKMRLLAEESEAQSDLNIQASRYWRIENTEVKNGLGTPVGYNLFPYVDTALPGALLLDPDSPLGRRAEFAKHALWVTKYDPEERYAMGKYPNQAPEDAGLTKWQQANRSLENEDIVVWHTICTTHFTQPENWPMTTMESGGFTLKPAGFFDRTPALDVPRSNSNGHCDHES